MRLGIRAQLLLAIGGILSLGLGPLFFAVASLVRASQTQSWERQAKALGRAIAGHVTEAQRHRDEPAMQSLLEAQLGASVGALGIYDARGRLALSAGEADARPALPTTVRLGREEAAATRTARGAGLFVVVPSDRGAVGTV
ncbi:MAG: two-component sensor histidine kinase, partial [Myxococcota bacterium]